MFKTNTGNDPSDSNCRECFLKEKKNLYFQGIPVLLNQVVQVFTHQS